MKLSLDVKIQSKVSSRVAFVKTSSLSLDSNKPIANQVQVISMHGDPNLDAESANQSFYAQLLQVTRHLYSPLARSARITGNNVISN